VRIWGANSVGIGGLLAASAMLAEILYKLTNSSSFFYLAVAFLTSAIGIYFPQIGWSKRLYVLIGIVLSLWTLTYLDTGIATLVNGLERSVFTAAFFIAMLSISSAAVSSSMLINCGLFIVQQPSGRRYAALTVGGHLFGLVMFYGAITLLGSLVAAKATKNGACENLGTQRMLLAVQRGFASTLPWTPLAFPVAVTIAIIPGANWAHSVFFCGCSSLIIMSVGWILDAVGKRQEAAVASNIKFSQAEWSRHLWPLLLLLGCILACASTVSFAMGLRISESVTIVAPMIAVIWLLFQSQNSEFLGQRAFLRQRLAAFSFEELPRARGEFTLVIMAPLIGILGAGLLLPMTGGFDMHLDTFPPPVLLVIIFWLLPVTGQLGMHPLLIVSFLAPLIPDPVTLGINPAVLVTTITSSWALTNITSPFTASVLVVARLGKVSPLQAGLNWNGLFGLLAGIILSIWISVLAILI